MISHLIAVCLVLCPIFYLASTFPSEVTYKHPCPKVADIQDPWVAQNFDLKKFDGVWYELAYHDYTQPGICKCMQSYKQFDASIPQLNDSFYLNCVGTWQQPELTFNLTDTVGYFEGHWPFVPNIVFPDTVVDIKIDENGNYVWVIEFQCVEIDSFIVFTGINFYHRSNKTSEADLNKMIEAARAHNLGEYLDTGLKITYVDHTNCSYPYTQKEKSPYPYTKTEKKKPYHEKNNTIV